MKKIRPTIMLILSIFIMTMLGSCDKINEHLRRQTGVRKKAVTPRTFPGLEAIIPAGAMLAKIITDIQFDTAATPLYFEGELYFTNTNFDQPDRCLTMKLERNGQVDTLMSNNGLISAIQPSGKGTFYCCQMLGHKVVEMDREGEIIGIIADTFDGRRIDGPNDLTVDKKGGVYFTDSQFIGEEPKMQETPAVYYVRQDGFIVKLIEDIEFPNGIELSPDGKTLYVINTRGEKTKGRYIRAYDVLEDGTVTNGRDFAEVLLTPEDDERSDGFSGADGSAVDSAGNLYIATTRGIGVQVFSPAGDHLGNIPCLSPTNNVAFGGEDMKTLYISAQDGIYMIPVMIPGAKVP